METRLENFLRQTSLVIQAKLNLAYFERQARLS